MLSPCPAVDRRVRQAWAGAHSVAGGRVRGGLLVQFVNVDRRFEVDKCGDKFLVTPAFVAGAGNDSLCPSVERP